MIWDKVLYIVILVLAGIGIQTLVGQCIYWVNSRIGKLEKDILEAAEAHAVKEEAVREFSIFKANIKAVKRGLKIIRTTIGAFELVLFATFTVIAIEAYGLSKSFEVVKFIGISASGWIALKIFGNYQQWSGPFLGRPIFYIFLIGSILNIAGGVILGLSISLLWP